MTRYHTLLSGEDDRAALAADMHLQAERVALGLQGAYVAPRKALRRDYRDCPRCKGTGGRFIFFACRKCKGDGVLRVATV